MTTTLTHPAGHPEENREAEWRIARLMGLEAASLAIMSFLHLSGVLGGGKPFDPGDASIAEGLICLVLAYGAATLVSGSAHRRRVAIASTGFAILGFIVGLSITVRGGHAVEIAYHATVLPLLLLTLWALLQLRARARRR